MRVLPSALKHGTTEDEIRAVLQVPMRRVRLEEGMLLVIGADSAAQLLEVVVADVDSNDPRVIHAMPLRPKFHHSLRGDTMTTKPHTAVDESTRAEELLDGLDPEVTSAEDPRELRRIGLALRAAQAADAELRAAVSAARDAGYTWADIGLTVGTTRQAAQARFRQPPTHP